MRTYLGWRQQTSGCATVLVGWLAVLALVGVPITAAKYWGTADDPWPMLTCGGTGFGVGVGCLVVRRVLGKRKPRNGLRWLGSSLLVLTACPGLAITAGLGANRLLDYSPTHTYQVRVVSWRSSAKGSAWCTVASWRGRDLERLPSAVVLDGQDDRAGRYPAACTPGTQVTVYIHDGALGWPWISGVRPGG